jgi:hypothetical protein
MNLIRIIREGTKAVPAVKYALGVAAIVAVVALVVSFKIDLRVALWGSIVLMALMIFLVLFAKLAATAPGEFKAPVKIMMWFFALLFIVICSLLTTSVFIKFPVDLQYLLRSADKTSLSAATPDPAGKRDKKADTVFNRSIGVNYIRLFGAMEVPYMMSIFNYPTRTLVKTNDGYFLKGHPGFYVSDQLAKFWKTKWEYKDALPFRSELWEQFINNNLEISRDLYWSALEPTLSDMVAYGMAITDDLNVEHRVADAILPDIKPHFKSKPSSWDAQGDPDVNPDNLDLDSGLATEDVGFLFVILSNTSSTELSDIDFHYEEYINSFKPVKEDLNHWKRKPNPDLLGLKDTALNRAEQKSDMLKLASLKPGASVIWLLCIYKKKPNGLPRTYLTNVFVPSRVTFTNNGLICQDSLRKPFGLQAARVAIPFGWQSQ